MKMIYPLACAALSTAWLAAAPALAQAPAATTNMNCSEASMKTMRASMMKMTDATKKAETMKEMDMAQDMIAKKNEKGCIMQMEKAMGMMK